MAKKQGRKVGERLTFDELLEGVMARAKETCEREFDVIGMDVVPSLPDLDDRQNEGVLLETTILYCDMRASSSLPEDHRRGTAARIYRSFLNTVVDIGKHYNGQIRGFAGDQVLMLFDPSTDMFRFAMQAALGIQSAVETGLNPLFARMFRRDVHCGIGVDFGPMLAIRVGGRGRSISDIVWVGNAANVACRFCNNAGPGEIVISPTVFGRMPPGFRKQALWGLLGDLPGDDVWSSVREEILGPVTSYCAKWDAVEECLAASDDEDND